VASTALRTARHAAGYPAEYVRAWKGARRIREEAGRHETLEEALEFARTFGWGNGHKIKPGQTSEEVLALLRLLETDPPRTILEIGTYNGGTLFLWTRVAEPDALIIAVDLFGARLGRHSPQGIVFRSFGRADQRIELLFRSDSHDERTLERVTRMLGGRPLDFLFVDGDHSYEGVKRDVEMYSPLVRPGGLVALHDIKPGDAWVDGVTEFWEDFRRERPVEEIDAGAGQGIGLYRIPS
jgi:predicted O-methyltransferase YrrM